MGALALSTALWLAACDRTPVDEPPEVVPGRLTLTPVGFGDLPDWSRDAHGDALPALGPDRLAPRLGFAVASFAGMLGVAVATLWLGYGGSFALAEEPVDQRDQILGGSVFVDHPIHAGLPGGGLELRRRQTAHHDHGHRCEARVRSYQRDEVAALHARHRQIRDDTIDALLKHDHGAPDRAMTRHRDVACRLVQVAHHATRRRAVVDDQHRHVLHRRQPKCGRKDAHLVRDGQLATADLCQLMS